MPIFAIMGIFAFGLTAKLSLKPGMTYLTIMIFLATAVLQNQLALLVLQNQLCLHCLRRLVRPEPRGVTFIRMSHLYILTLPPLPTPTLLSFLKSLMTHNMNDKN
jgi:hypothetical protein